MEEERYSPLESQRMQAKKKKITTVEEQHASQGPLGESRRNNGHVFRKEKRKNVLELF